MLIDYIAGAFPPLNLAAAADVGSTAAPALFELLDADQDGRLGRSELASAEQRLAVRDFDDDGLVSERELIVDPTLAAESVSPAGRRKARDPQRTIWLSPATTKDSVAAALIGRYDRNGDGLVDVRTAPVEMALPPETVARLDADQDGRLSAAELRDLAAEPAAAVLQLAFGSGGSPGRSAPGGSPAAGLRVRRKIDGGYKLQLDDLQIDVQRNNRDPRQNGRGDLALGRFDADQNGYVDRAEARNNPLLASAFDAADADHDDKLTDGEWQVYATGQNSAAATRVTLQVIDRGQDLFSLLDQNGDGLLTPRELREAAALVDSEDRDGDGALGGSEIPVRWSLEVARGLPLAGTVTATARRTRALRNWRRAAPGPTGSAAWTAIMTATCRRGSSSARRPTLPRPTPITTG